MNSLALILCWASWVGDAPVTPIVDGDQPLRLQAIQVPATNLAREVQIYLQGEARSLAVDEFRRRLAEWRTRELDRERRLPTVGRLEARWDEQHGRLIGTAEWRFARGAGRRLTIAPCDLPIDRITLNGQDNSEWGAWQPAAISVLETPTDECVIRAEWSLVGRKRQREWSFAVRVPAVAMGGLDLTLPAGWTVSGEVGSVIASPSPGPTRLLADAEGTLRWTIKPVESQQPSAILYATSGEVRLDERGVELDAEVRIEPTRNPPSVVLIETDAADTLAMSSDVPGDWERSRSDGRDLWRFRPDLPQEGRWVVRWQGRLGWPTTGRWSVPSIQVGGGDRLLDRWTISSPISVRWTSIDRGSFEIEDEQVRNGRRSVTLAGISDASRPSLTLESVLPRVESQSRMLLDLSRHPLRLRSEFEVSADQGDVHRLAVVLPTRWRYVEATADPVGVDSVRTEAPRDQETRLELSLTRPIRVGEQARVAVTAEYEERTDSIAGDYVLRLPEIVLSGASPVSVERYELRLDPNVPCNLEQLPPSPVGWDEGPANDGMYVFAYTPPMPETTLTLLPRSVRLRGSLKHVVRRWAQRWEHDLGIDVHLRQGSLETVHLVSTQPLPTDISWEVADRDNEVESFETFPVGDMGDALGPPAGDRPADEEESPDQPPVEHHYLVRFSLPVKGSVRLRAAWSHSGEQASVPILHIPDADEFSGSVEVMSPEGLPVEVEARGLIGGDPERTLGVDLASAPIWMATYDRLPTVSELTLTVARASSRLGSASMGRAFVKCRTLVESASLIYVVETTLVNDRTVPLTLSVPSDAYIWQLRVDDVPISPALQDSTMEILRELSPGRHELQLVYSCARSPWLGISRLELPRFLATWDVLATQWTVADQREISVFSGAGFRQAVRSWQLSSSKPAVLVDVAGTTKSGQLLRDIRSRFYSLPRRESAQPMEVLVALSEAARPGGSVVVDQCLRTKVGVAHSANESLEDWLARENWLILVHDDSFVITSTVNEPLQEPLLRSWDVEDWVHDVVLDVERAGMDPTGRFVLGSRNLLGKPSASGRQLGVDPNFQSGMIWSAYVTNNADGTERSITVVPAELLTRANRFLTFAGLAILLLLGWRWSTRTHRVLLLILLLGALIAVLVGEALHVVFSVPIWSSVAAISLILVTRSSSRLARRSSGPVGLAVSLLVTSPAPAEETPIERVLIPVDAQGQVDRVIVREPFHRRLLSDTEVTPSDVVWRSAEYEGQELGDGIAQWTGQLTGTRRPVDRPTQPIRFTMGDAVVDRIALEGAEIPFRLLPGGTVQFDVPDARAVDSRSIRVAIGFHTAVRPQEGGSSIQWQPPVAAQRSFSFRPLESAKGLSRRSLEAGWREEADNAGRIFRSTSGSAGQMSVDWLTGNVAEDGPANVESIQLWEFDGTTAVWTYSAKGTGGSRSITVALDAGLAVHTVIGSGVEDWWVEPLAGGGRRLHIAMSSGDDSSRAMEVRGLALLSSTSRLHLGRIAWEGSATERAWVAIVGPPGWQITNTEREGWTLASQDDLAAAWSRLRPDAAPSETNMVLLGEGQSARRFEVAWARPRVNASIEQRLSAAIDPNTGFSQIDARVTLREADRRLSHLRCRLPAGHQAVQVKSSGLADWFQEGPDLELLFADGVSAGQVIEFRLQHVVREEAGRRSNQPEVELLPPAWEGVQQVATRWEFKPVRGWKLNAESGSAAVSAVEGEPAILTTTDLDPVKVQLLAEPRELLAESLTQVSVRDRQADVVGQFLITAVKGSFDRLEFRTPKGLVNLRWEVENLPPPTSRVEGNQRIWRIRSPRSIVGQLIVKWRTSMYYDAGEATIPRVVLQAKTGIREWVTLTNLTDRSIEVDAPGLVVSELPSDLKSLVNAVSTSTTYLGEASDWRLTFRLQDRPAQQSAYRVEWGEMDLFHIASDDVRGRSEWHVSDTGAGVLSFLLPNATRIDACSIDGEPVSLAASAERRLTIPVYRVGRPQRVTMEWSTTPDDTEKMLRWPILLGGEEYPVLIRLRRNNGVAGKLVGDRLDRTAWLAERFNHRVKALGEWSTYPGGTKDGDEIASRLREALWLDQELQASLRLSANVDELRDGSASVTPHPATALAQELSEQRTMLAADFAGRLPSDNPTSTTSVYDRLEQVPSDHVEYARWCSGVDSISWTSTSTWTLRTLTTNQWVRLYAAGIAFFAVAVSPLWIRMSIYWPTFLLAIGVAWSQFADSYPIGWILMAVAIAGTYQTVRAWMTEATLDSASTLMRRSTTYDKTRQKKRVPV